VIDDKYDVAVTTSVGRLNNIVVDTVEQGQACMEHLRKANAGRANIICLDKLPVRDFGSSDTPEGVPRLFDLIKPKDPKFAVAFYFAMRDTLVANDMEQAKRISYGKRRWRVVTLQGGLIETSGTMSGGGTRVMRGGMSSKFTGDKVEPEVVARYEQESADAEHDMATFQQGRRALETECASLEKRIPEVEMALEKVEMDLQTSGKRIKDAEQRLKEAQ
jgi:structural maintenance of chromosome 4